MSAVRFQVTKTDNEVPGYGTASADIDGSGDASPQQESVDGGGKQVPRPGPGPGCCARVEFCCIHSIYLTFFWYYVINVFTDTLLCC